MSVSLRPGVDDDDRLKRITGLAAMDLEGADRILSAVGADSYPADLDRSALVRGLALCQEWYREALRYGTAQAEKNHVARLGQIFKTARKLKQLLDEDDRQKLYDW